MVEKQPTREEPAVFLYRGDWTRTSDFMVPNHARYQLRYAPQREANRSRFQPNLQQNLFNHYKNQGFITNNPWSNCKRLKLGIFNLGDALYIQGWYYI